MIDANFQTFDKRIRRLTKRNRRLSHGYVMTVNHDGLVVANVRPQKTGFPWFGLVLIFAGLLVFKGFLFAQLGPLTYEDRVGKLANGTVIEQGGAYIMYADPITISIAGNFSPILK